MYVIHSYIVQKTMFCYIEIFTDLTYEKKKEIQPKLIKLFHTTKFKYYYSLTELKNIFN